MLRVPIYPLLIALYPVVSFYNVNSQYQAAKVLVIPTVIAIAFAGVLWVLLFLVMRSWRRAAFLSFVVLLFLGSYKYLNDPFHELRIELGGLIVGPNKVLLALFVLVFVTLLVYLMRSRKEFERLTTVLNAACLVLVTLPISGILWDKFAPYVFENQAGVQAHERVASVAQEDSSQLPDIYHILLDGYGRQDIYKELYGYDNSDLLDYLNAEGFYIAQQARANYSWTAPAVAAFMNLDYIEQVLPDVAKDETDRTLLFSAIRDNRVFEILRDRGYRIVAFESGLPTTEFDWQKVTVISPNSAGVWGLGFLNEFQAGLLELTPVPSMVKAVSGDKVSRNALTRQYMDFAFDNLGRPAMELDPALGGEGPNLFFAHIAGPHAPHLYTEDGKPFDPPESHLGAKNPCRMRGLSRDTYIHRHVGYVKHLNRRLKETLQRIMENATRDYAIVIQSDHGPRAWCRTDNVLDLNYIRERLSILTAIYLPDQRYDNLYHGMTPVNIYRAVLNNVLDTDFAFLPDKSHMTPFNNPFRNMLVREDQFE